MAMYCNNCGEKGHVFRSCSEPILSCGIVLLDAPSLPVSFSTSKILMIRRKDSMSFVEFMRGKYDANNLEYVSTLIVNMTQAEQQMITTIPFDLLWRQLWGDDHTSIDYTQSRAKFMQLDIQGIVNANQSPYEEPEWGFPKGRRIRAESDIECAIREFVEETNVPREAYTMVNNIVLEETFVGLNNIQYRHLYFIALLKNPGLVNLNQKFTHMQRREISGIAWKSLEECKDYVRPHHLERGRMLDDLRNIAETYEIM